MITAKELSARLLEDYDASDAERAGSPDDPWRKATHKIKFGKKDFTGKRGKDDLPDEDSNGKETHDTKQFRKKESSKPNRFMWKPGVNEGFSRRLITGSPRL